jgi:hypothetical protein
VDAIGDSFEPDSGVGSDQDLGRPASFDTATDAEKLSMLVGTMYLYLNGEFLRHRYLKSGEVVV